MPQRDARYHVNRESFELWLVTRARRVPIKAPSHRDEASGRSGKPGSEPNQDLTWLEAISQPDVVEVDRFFEGCLNELKKHPVRVMREAYRMLWIVYIGPSADVSLPEYWRRRRAERKRNKERENPFDTIYAELLESAFDHVMEKARREGLLLYWPTPEAAREYVETNAKRRRESRYQYLKERDRGTPVTEAVRRAARRSGSSEQAVWTWKKRGRWEGGEKAGPGPKSIPSVQTDA